MERRGFPLSSIQTDKLGPSGRLGGGGGGGCKIGKLYYKLFRILLSPKYFTCCIAPHTLPPTHTFNTPHPHPPLNPPTPSIHPHPPHNLPTASTHPTHTLHTPHPHPPCTHTFHTLDTYVDGSARQVNKSLK
jgi:hypothetical protein